MTELGAHGVSAREVVDVARHGVAVGLSEQARDAMAERAAVVERIAASDEPAYGVSTGFGSLAHDADPGRAPRRACSGR